MDYYQRKQRATELLLNWIQTPERTPFYELCRKVLLETGIGRQTLLRTIKNEFPMFEIENDQLVTKQ